MADPKRRYFEVNTVKQKPARGTVRYGYLQRPAGKGAIAFRDEIGDVLTLQQSGAGLTLNLSEATADFAFNSAYNANPALADLLYKNVQLNHDRELTYDLYPHIHWLQAKNYVPNFLLEYRYQLSGGAKTTAWTKLVCITSVYTYTAGTIHQRAKSVGIAVPVGSDISDIIQFRIYRDSGNVSGEFAGADPYNTGGNASVSILSFDVHIRIDQVGSTTENTK